MDMRGVAEQNTDGLCSYSAAIKELGNADRHEAGGRLNPLVLMASAIERFTTRDMTANSNEGPLSLAPEDIRTRNIHLASRVIDEG